MVAYIGIDLGTSACCVASYSDGEAEVILNEDECPTTPSYVAFSGNQRLIGSAAFEQANENVGNTIYDAKRFIGRKFDDPDIADLIKSCTFEVINEDNKPKFKLVCFGEDKILTPEQISAMLLIKLKEQVGKSLDVNISEAVITVPAYFNSEQREATLAAAKIAEINVIRLIHEPTAAILAHGLDQNFVLEEKLILVFDLGGGTFDITIVRCKNEVFTVMKTGGDSALGGRDFDSRLMSFLEPDVAKQCGKGLSESKTAMMKLMESCKEAKHRLSSVTNAKIEIPDLLNGNNFEVEVSRARLEALCADLFTRIDKYIADTLEDAKLKPDQISFVLMVGGSSKIPKIRESLKEKFPSSEVIYNGDPEQVVARGAAIQAALIKRSAELKSVVFQDVCPLSLGVAVKDGKVSVVIPRNEPIPCVKKKEFRTTIPNQKAITCKVYEGERKFQRYNNYLGQFVLEGIEPAPVGKYAYDVYLALDEDGILTVTEIEVHTGKKCEMKIGNSRDRNTSRDIQAMVNDEERFRESDKKELERLELKDKFQSYIEEVECNARGNQAVLTETQKAQNWLKENRNCCHQDLEQKFTEFQSKPLWKLIHQTQQTQ